MGAGGGGGGAAGGVPVQGPEGAVVRVAGVEGRRVVERPGQDRPVGEGALRGGRARPRRRAGRAAAAQDGGAGGRRLAAGLLRLVRRGGDLGQRPELGLGEGRLLRRVDDRGAGGGGQQRVQVGGVRRPGGGGGRAVRRGLLAARRRRPAARRTRSQRGSAGRFVGDGRPVEPLLR